MYPDARPYNIYLLLLVLAIPLWSSAAVAGAPDFPAPPRAQVQWVSSNMVYNGRVMQVRTFNSRLSAERVLQFYRNLWKQGEKNRPGYRETDALQPWQIISRIDEEYLLTVQVQQAGNDSNGYLALSRLEDVLKPKPDDLGDGFPMMRGSDVLNDIVTPDFGKDGRTLLIQNDYTVSGNANYYRNWYEGRGWQLDMDMPSSPGQQHVLAFSKGRKKVNLVITRQEGRTDIVANSND